MSERCRSDAPDPTSASSPPDSNAPPDRRADGGTLRETADAAEATLSTLLERLGVGGDPPRDEGAVRGTLEARLRAACDEIQRLRQTLDDYHDGEDRTLALDSSGGEGRG